MQDLEDDDDDGGMQSAPGTNYPICYLHLYLCLSTPPPPNNRGLPTQHTHNAHNIWSELHFVTRRTSASALRAPAGDYYLGDARPSFFFFFFFFFSLFFLKLRFFVLCDSHI